MTTASKPDGLARALLELSKPRITALVTLCAGAGYAAAPRTPGAAPLGWTLLGVALASASTACLNQAMEAAADGRMRRTAGRPIPSGTVSSRAAAAVGALWGVAGIGLLMWKSAPWAAALTAATLVSYLAVYTPMKRRSPASTWIGAVPGALPPVIGWAAAGGPLDERAAALFAIQFFWQMPHFLALAWMYREDYARGGFRVLPVVRPDGLSTGAQMRWTSGALVLCSVLPFAQGLAGGWYLAGATAAGAWMLALAVAAARTMADAAVKRVFLASLVYLPLVLALLALDRG